MNYDLNLLDLILVQGHDTPFGRGQQLFEKLPRSNLEVRSHGPDKDLYMCAL